MTIHRRIISLCYDDNKPLTFITNEEQQAYFAAIGRMMVYGLAREGPASIDLVCGGLQALDEITCSYSAKLDEDIVYPDGYKSYNGSNGQLTDSFLQAMQEKGLDKHRAFTVGAVKSGGKWGFHS